MEDPLVNHQNNAEYDDYGAADDDNQNNPMTAAAAGMMNAGNVATPEQREESNEERMERAAAAAEVLVMEGGSNGGRRNGGRNPTSDAALLGATGTEDVVAPLQTLDESGELVRQAFVEFLQNYKQRIQREDTTGNEAELQEEEGGDLAEYMYPYQEQADLLAKRQLMRRNVDVEDDFVVESASGSFANTLFVNFEHLLKDDPELAEAIQGEYTRFDSPLRRAVSSFVVDRHPILNQFLEPERVTREDGLNQAAAGPSDPLVFFVAFFNLPSTKSIRQLRMDLVGCLVSLQGTITRTSEVRPELMMGSFRCTQCGLVHEKVAQNFTYTRPQLCRNPRCKNMSPSNFQLEETRSEFVDWQKLRVQESSHQIPPGSMPRSMDVILRNEMVERAKAGDKCVFTGSLVVLPDASALSRAGDPTGMTKSAPRPSDAATGGGGGVSGLKALGVREMTYRTCFLVNSVLSVETLQQANANEQVMASVIFGNHVGSGNTGSGGAVTDGEPTTNQVAMEMTAAQRAEFRAMRNSPRLYEQMVDSIAPTTFGHREVKKGVLLMLLGGVHKTTPDGIKLRGDINVCVVGDPSTAKSQFLKYVHSFIPNRAVYTSGKGSSAAGLTAAVKRDSDTGEYCIEAGALMLADNGVCCIDEFDKMEERDQVAIHEAMEQQTISITKAGIQATLNARASILAAANPIYGRYDRTKTLKANVTLSAPILSRFDLFFVVLDDCNPDADRQVAQHILNVHRCEGANSGIKAPFTKDQMRRYIKFARTLHPKITPESQRVMVDCYRKLRQGDTLGRSRSAYRITVRQLESMIRLSEALARLHCADEITPAFVREAYRLLKTSIIQVETSDVEVEEDEDDDDQDGGGENDPTGMSNDNDDDDDDSDVDDGDDDDDHGPDSQRPESQLLETQQQVFHPGEYRPESQDGPSSGGDGGEAKDGDDPVQTDGDVKPEPIAADAAAAETKPKKTKKKKKKKTKISFEEYEAITNAIAGHLRQLESEVVDSDQAAETPYWTWQQVLTWYLEQVEQDIMGEDDLEAMKKKVNLVIRRLIDVDRILVTVGDVPKSKKEESKTLLAVHPNYEV